MAFPFTLRLFSPSGSASGVLIASRDDWTGRALIFPKELVGEVQGRKEYRQPGIYVLVSPNKLYIGEGDPVGKRIDSHVAKKDFWRRGVVFTAEGSRLNKAHIQYLESKLIALARERNNVEVENVVQPTLPALSEEDYAFCDTFLAHMLLTLPLIGFGQFEEGDADVADDADDVSETGGVNSIQGTGCATEADKPAGGLSAGKTAVGYNLLPRGMKFTLVTKGVTAVMKTVEDGVQILKGSQVFHPPSPRFEVDSASYAGLRRQLTEAGVIAEVDGAWRLTEDQFFSSSSAAAAVVRGSHSNGDWWKDETGRTFGEVMREAKEKASAGAQGTHEAASPQ